MKKITCITPDGYQGHDADKPLVIVEGDTVDVSDEKHAQLKADFADAGWFDFSGKPHKPAAVAAEDAGE